MLSGSTDLVALDVQALVPELTPSGRSAALAQIARTALQEALVQNQAALGYLPAFITVVDGILGALETTVKPNGEIDYVFDLVQDQLRSIYQALTDHAPVLTGQYRDSIKLFADGNVVDPLGAIPSAARYVFLSDVAYARKIEGSSGRKPQSSQAPNGVFEAVAAIFGVTFTYISPESGGIVDWAQTAGAQAHAAHRGGQAHLHQAWLTAVPAIVITSGK